MSQQCNERHSRVTSPSLKGTESNKILPTFTGLELEAILGPYARLPPPPEGSGNDIGLDFNPHLPPWPIDSNKWAESPVDVAELPCLPDTPLASPLIAHRREPSPLGMAVDAAADALEELSSLPDSSLGLSRLELSSRPSFASFDTSVRDLIQSRPDSPIGGQEAAPMVIKPKRSFNVGTLVIAQGRILPRIKVSCTDGENFLGDDMNKLSNVRSTTSESQDMYGTGIENRPPRSAMLQQTSDTSPPMITAPESPRSYRYTDSCDVSPMSNHWAETSEMDGAGLDLTEVRDFALASDGSRSKKPSRTPDKDPVKIKKDINVHISKKENASKVPGADPKVETGIHMSIGKNENASKDAASAKIGKGVDASKKDNASKVSDAAPAKVDDGVLDPDFCDDPAHYPLSPKSLPPKLSPPAVPSALDEKRRSPAIDSAGKKVPPPAVPKDAGGKKNVALPKDAALPIDATGALPTPDTPKLPKGRRLLNKGHTAIRRARGVVFRTPVLQVVVGRQLAPTCSTGLKLIAKGGSFETPKLVPSAVPTPPAPVPT